MDGFVDSLLVLLLLSNFVMIGSSQLRTLISMSALQGVILAIVTLLLHVAQLTIRTWVLAGTILLVLGVLIPILLRWAVTQSGVEREILPYVGFSFSMFIGTVIVAVSFLISFAGISPLSYLLPYALASLLFGLFLIITRRKAITQVIGYIVFGNAIYLFGIGLAAEQPLLVELGVLFNTFVAVFVMGIGIYRITQELDDIDVAQLNALRDE